MPNVIARPPIVRQYTLTGTPVKLSDVPHGVVAARMVSTVAWTYGDTVDSTIFPVAADMIEEMPTAGVRDTYFAGGGQLIVAFFVS